MVWICLDGPTTVPMSWALLDKCLGYILILSDKHIASFKPRVFPPSPSNQNERLIGICAYAIMFCPKCPRCPPNIRTFFAMAQANRSSSLEISVDLADSPTMLEGATLSLHGSGPSMFCYPPTVQQCKRSSSSTCFISWPSPKLTVYLTSQHISYRSTAKPKTKKNIQIPQIHMISPLVSFRFCLPGGVYELMVWTKESPMCKNLETNQVSTNPVWVLPGLTSERSSAKAP